MNKQDPLADQNNAVRVMDGTPAGKIVIAASEKGVVGLEMRRADDETMYQQGSATAARIADRAVKALAAYFGGELLEFNVPICLDGLSEFQRAVLKHTAQIPFGHVETYGEVVQAIGKPNSARAVGGALARNPIAIMIPCHRVVAHDGRLHGFSSPDGIRTKARLLAHEGVTVADERVKLSGKGAA